MDAPNDERGAPEIAHAAREFLSERLLGRDADLVQLAGGTDRWGRTVADLVLADPWDGSAGSTAAALLTAGYARVRPSLTAVAAPPSGSPSKRKPVKRD